MTTDVKYRKLRTETASAGKFAVVGVIATLTHAAVASSLLASGALPPLAANLGGYLVAFWVSFGGHYFWSFAHLRQKGTAFRSIIRFLIISVSGFLLNSAILSLWLKLTPWPEMTGLLFSIAIVPALTFLAARLWAFSHHPAET
ncbi:GtrA family protein [Roseibium sp.]|uniref:GtrA family protein n=1 Tax=Roseibium sp. TaxID=1936156 RepID=UPI003D0D4F90